MGYPIEEDQIDRHPVIVEENIKWLKGLGERLQHQLLQLSVL